MGDHLAVGIAVRAHIEMLVEVGGCDPRFFVRTRFPFPRSGVQGGPGERVEAVVVDDHPVVEKILRGADRATVPSAGTTSIACIKQSSMRSSAGGNRSNAKLAGGPCCHSERTLTCRAPRP